MIQVIQRKTPWGEVAGGFGKGLGESFSEEVGRHVTAKGIEKLSSQMSGDKPLTELQLVAGIDRIPGMTPEKAAYLIPILQRAQSRKAQELRAGGGGQQPIEAGQSEVGAAQQPSGAQSFTDTTTVRETPRGVTATESIQESDSVAGTQPITLITKESVDQAKAQKPVWTQLQRDQEIHRILQEDPTITTEAARTLAGEREQRGIDQWQSSVDLMDAQVAKRDSFEDVFSKDTARLLNLPKSESGTVDFGSVDGEVMSRVQNRYMQKMANGSMSSQEAAQAAAKDVAELTRAMAALAEMEPFGKLGAGTKDLKNIYTKRRKFEELGLLDVFNDQLQSVANLSPHHAAALSYPISKTAANAPIREVGAKGKAPDFAKSNEQLAKVLTDVAHSVSPNDSIDQMALILKNRGYGPSNFYNYLREAYDNKEVSLTAKQLEDLDASRPVESGLTDLWMGSINRFFHEPGMENFKQTLRQIAGTQ